MSDFSKAFGSLGSLMGSTAAGAVGNIASGAANALFGGIQARRNWKYKKKEMELQQKYNLENMQKQFDYQQEAWNRENRYNDPRNASARWRLAGISPNAVFGNSPGGAGVAGSAGTPDVSNPSAGGNVDTSAYHPTLTPVEMMRAQNEKKVADSQADLNKALADKARGDTKDPGITKQQQKLDFDWSLVKKQREEVQKSVDEINSEYQRAINEADLQIKQQILFETMAKIDKLLADKEVSEEMKLNLKEQRNLIKEQRNLIQAQVDTEKSKQRSLDADAEYKDAIRETENLLRSGKHKLQTREIMKVVYETFGQDLSNARQIEEIARLMTATDRPSSIPAYLDKIAEQIGGSDQDAKWEAKARLSKNLRKLLKSYDD